MAQAIRSRCLGNARSPVTEGKGAASQALFGHSLSTRPRVRAALFNRAVGHDELLRSLDIPVLVLHGTEDLPT